MEASMERSGTSPRKIEWQGMRDEAAKRREHLMVRRDGLQAELNDVNIMISSLNASIETIDNQTQEAPMPDKESPFNG